MPHYIKVCPVCMEQFFSKRSSRTYCSKKCTNRSRSIPSKLLEVLMEKSSKAIQVIPTVPKIVRDFITKNPSYSLNNISDIGGINKELQAAGISAEDQITLLEQAKKLKEQRRKEELEKEFSTKESTKETLKPVLSDPEMENFKL